MIGIIVFSILQETKDWLINQEFDVEEELIVSREWRLKENKYKSRFRINGVLVNRDQISELRSLLFDFTLQGDTYILNNSFVKKKSRNKIFIISRSSHCN